MQEILEVQFDFATTVTVTMVAKLIIMKFYDREIETLTLREIERTSREEAQLTVFWLISTPTPD